MRILLPDELAGGDVLRYLRELGFGVRKASDGVWTMTEPHRPATMLETKTLAAPWRHQSSFDRAVLPQDAYAPAIDQSRIDNEMHRAHRKAHADDFGAMLYALQMQVVLSSDAGLPSRTQHVHETLRRIVDRTTQEPQFPNSGAHLVRYADELHTRIRFPAFSLRIDQDPQLVNDLRRGDVEPNHLYFEAGAAFVENALIPGTFLSPLLACQSPRVWGFPATRVSGAIIFSLGTTITGLSPIPSESLYVLPRTGIAKLPERAALPEPKAWEAAIDWWGIKLNQLLDIITNPCIYADSAGNYDPYHHQAWLMNTSELFQRISSTLLSWHDGYAARTLTYTALDMLEGTWIDAGYDALCSPRYAAKTLTHLEQSHIPSDVKSVLLPAARAAVDALTETGEGFYIARYRNLDTIDLLNGNGTNKILSREAATVKLLVERRNATHGFSNRPDPVRDRLLAHHNGHLPVELSYLPFFYLLAVLNDTQRLRDRIIRSAQRRGPHHAQSSP